LLLTEVDRFSKSLVLSRRGQTELFLQMSACFVNRQMQGKLDKAKGVAALPQP
jgi:hypothetical protein